MVVSLHPKKVGLVFNPPLTNPFLLGTAGIRIETFWFSAKICALEKVVYKAEPFGQE